MKAKYSNIGFRFLVHLIDDFSAARVTNYEGFAVGVFKILFHHFPVGYEEKHGHGEGTGNFPHLKQRRGGGGETD
jgi:hypothetical protein